MIRHIRAIGTLSVTLVISALLSSTAFAGPYIGKPIHAPYPYPASTTGSSTTANASSTSGNMSDTSSNSSATTTGIPKHPVTTEHTGTNTGGSTTQTTTTAQVKQRLSPPQLKICQARSMAITALMSRADIRAQNQVALFTNIATHVESFYTSKGKTIATYSSLVATVNSDEAQTNTDIVTLKADSTFRCSSNDPGSAVSTYRTDLLAVQEDNSNLRTAVKNLIVGVAQAEGYGLSKSATEGGQ